MTPTEDFDPEKTLFFKRRRDQTRLLPLIVVCVLILGSGALVVWAISHPSVPVSEDVGSAPYHRTPVPAALAAPPQPAAPAPVAADAPPTVPDAGAPLNLDVKDPGNAQVRDDVLRRIDLMPGVSAANKDKLYASVDHARSMGRVLTIPFVKGDTSVRAAEIEHLRQELEAPSIQSIADDPTVVFVILGYADQKGSDKINADISLSRARNVLDALRDRCGLQNVMHAVAMGGSTLFSTRQADKNRVAEVWMVAP